MSYTRKSCSTSHLTYDGKHRFEHWYRDNQVYFITARCRERFPAFATEEAKAIFWGRFNHYTNLHAFEPWITTLLDNHYHTLGYLARGNELGEMMRKLHGSVAKLVNDFLPERRRPFWHDRRHHDYFDGCLRSIEQLQRSWRYTLLQSVRARVAQDPLAYRHTVIRVGIDESIHLATERDALLTGIRYKRYEQT